MATWVSSFSLSDGDGTSCTVMKLVTSNKSKREITITGCCFKKCGDDGCVPCKTSSNGSTPCIAWVPSYASLRSKYRELFFLIQFFPKGFSLAFFFLHFGKFLPQIFLMILVWWISSLQNKKIQTNYLPS